MATENQKLEEDPTEEEATVTTEDTTESTETTEPETPDQSDQPDDDSTASTNREAAKYRRQLRATESDRDTYKQRAETLAQQIIEETLPDHIKPALFWKILPDDYDSLLTPEGRVDFEAVTNAVTTIETQFGLKPARFQGTADGGGGNVTEPETKRTTWKDLLKSR